MPVESYAPDGHRWGWACTEEHCLDHGPMFDTKDEASDDLDRHMNEKHPRSAPSGK